MAGKIFIWPKRERAWRGRALSAAENTVCKTLLKVVKHWQISVKRLLNGC